MKEIAILLTVTCFISLNSNAQFGNRRMRGIELEEKGYTINVDTTTLVPKSILIDGIKMQIQPIDPSSLNDQFYYLYNLNGQYKYSYYDESREKYFFKKNRRRSKYKTDIEFTIEGANWLLDNDIISDEIFDDINRDLVSQNDSTKSEYPVEKRSSYNPYYLGGKYLSTFDIKFENNTDKAQTLSALMQLSTNNTTLIPLSTAKILSFQRQGASIAHLEALERFNYVDDIIIPPNSVVKKYIAFLPFDLMNNTIELLVSTENESKRMSWNLNIDKKYINERYFYYAIKILNESYPYYSYYHINGEVDAHIEDDILYINKEDINNNMSIFCYCRGLSLSYGTVDFKAIDYLDFDKNKRSSINIELEKIEEVKKRK